MHNFIRPILSILLIASMLIWAGCLGKDTTGPASSTGNNNSTTDRTESANNNSGKLTKVQAKKKEFEKFSPNYLLLQGGWGTAKGQFGKAGGGAASAPGAFTVDVRENIYVLDQANKRIQKFDSQGQLVAQIKIPVNTGEDLTVDDSGAVYLLDQQSTKKIYKLNAEGEIIATYPAETDQFAPVTYIFAEAGTLYVEIAHNKVYKIGPKDKPAQIKDAPVVPGRKIAGADEYIYAKFRDNVAYVDIYESQRKPVLQTKLESPRPVERILSLDVDNKGNIYVGLYLVKVVGKERKAQHTVLAFDKNGKYLGEADLPEANSPDKTRIIVSSKGTIYQMQVTDREYKIVQWQLEK